MHNMLVSDRIMEGNVYVHYNPINHLDIMDLDKEEIAYPEDFESIVAGGWRVYAPIG